MELYLVRHGDVEGNPTGEAGGPPLSELGLQQVQRCSASQSTIHQECAPSFVMVEKLHCS